MSSTGLERSVVTDWSPSPALAVLLAGQGKSREAWTYWETDLARGLLDDLSGRQLRPLTPQERARESELAGQLQKLDERIAAHSASGAEPRPTTSGWVNCDGSKMLCAASSPRSRTRWSGGTRRTPASHRRSKRSRPRWRPTPPWSAGSMYAITAGPAWFAIQASPHGSGLPERARTASGLWKMDHEQRNFAVRSPRIKETGASSPRPRPGNDWDRCCTPRRY